MRTVALGSACLLAGLLLSLPMELGGCPAAADAPWLLGRTDTPASADGPAPSGPVGVGGSAGAGLPSAATETVEGQPGPTTVVSGSAPLSFLFPASPPVPVEAASQTIGGMLPPSIYTHGSPATDCAPGDGAGATPGGSGGSSSGSTNSGGSGSGGTPGDAPGSGPGGGGMLRSDAVNEAVALVAEQLVTAAAALGTCTPLADPRIDLGVNKYGSWGQCPVIAYVSGSLYAAIHVDYGDAGCSAPFMAGRWVIGGGGTIIVQSTHTADVRFLDLVVGGRAVSGGLKATLANGGGIARLSGTCVIDTAGVGRTAGELAVTLSQDGALILSSGELAMDDGGARYTVTPAGVAIDPVANGNFVPGGGSVAFAIGGVAESVVMTFTAESPQTGTVLVSVDGGAAYEYQVPGLGA